MMLTLWYWLGNWIAWIFVAMVVLISLILMAIAVGFLLAFLAGVIQGFRGVPLRKSSSADKLPAEIRARVMARDNFTCQECGETEDLTVDHIIPRSRGGASTMDNLRTLCRSCNSSKGAKMASY